MYIIPPGRGGHQPGCPDGAEILKQPRSIEYLARIEYEAQMKYADVPAMPWAELSETHREIARAGIRAVFEALGVSQ